MGTKEILQWNRNQTKVQQIKRNGFENIQIKKINSNLKLLKRFIIRTELEVMKKWSKTELELN